MAIRMRKMSAKDMQPLCALLCHSLLDCTWDSSLSWMNEGPLRHALPHLLSAGSICLPAAAGQSVSGVGHQTFSASLVVEPRGLPARDGEPIRGAGHRDADPGAAHAHGAAESRG